MPKSRDRTSDVNAIEKNYRAFLLRCWRDASGASREGATWRFALVQAGSEKRKMGFACLEDLFRYLKIELDID